MSSLCFWKYRVLWTNNILTDKYVCTWNVVQAIFIWRLSKQLHFIWYRFHCRSVAYAIMGEALGIYRRVRRKRYKRKRKINEILLSCVRHCCRYFIIIIIAFILFKGFGYIVKSQSERSEDDGKLQKYAKSENRCWTKANQTICAKRGFDGTPIDYVLTAGGDSRLLAKSKSKTGLTHPHLLVISLKNCFESIKITLLNYFIRSKWLIV